MINELDSNRRSNAPLPDPFPHQGDYGDVDLRRDGQNIVVNTIGVVRYTLLISPEEFDLDQPITVRTNGNLSFSGVVASDVGTLLRWWRLDRDRTMLFAAEITIEP